MLAVSLHAWARFISPGYDLYWFSQAISNVILGNGLVTSSERLYPSLLVQHWEPILYTAVPFAFVLPDTIAIVIWQVLGFALGTGGAWKVASFLFKNYENKNIIYLLTLFYVFSWANINPISFDIHPPVYGGLLFIPWIIYFILQPKPFKLFICLFLLLNCGEIYFAIVPTYICYYILNKKLNLFNIMLSIIIYLSGFIAIGIYQKYIGPLWSGLPFNYTDRYANIGGDGLGILKTFISSPMLVIGELFSLGKIKLFLKLLTYYGFLPLFSIFHSNKKLLVLTLWGGTLAYFIQAGLTSYEPIYSTNTHYISAIGSQWWVLSILGIHAILFEKNIFLNKFKIFFAKNALIPFFLALFFLNSSVWRKSPLYPIRGVIEKDLADNEIRTFLAELPKEYGALFSGIEWLCPLTVEKREHILCELGGEYFLEKMPLNVIIFTKNEL